jgi:3-deoxy-manno-octulosonate cytidylyltransferase (CMP-KDO synthetase)
MGDVLPERVLVVIPARYGSTRFPGKALARICGTAMIVRVAARAVKIKGADRVIVATDDDRILEAVRSAGFEAELTSRTHRSGTQRVAEVAAGHRYGIILNIQGDEPLFPLRGVEQLILAMHGQRGIQMGTLASQCVDEAAFARKDVVKVVIDGEGNAIYFSRAPVPHGAKKFLHHIGIYAFRRKFLLRYGSLPQGPLEKTEGLEQLRAVENGFPVKVLKCRASSFGVDRPSDIKRVENQLKSR